MLVRFAWGGLKFPCTCYWLFVFSGITPLFSRMVSETANNRKHGQRPTTAHKQRTHPDNGAKVGNTKIKQGSQDWTGSSTGGAGWRGRGGEERERRGATVTLDHSRPSNLLQIPPNLFNPYAFAKAMGLTNKFDTRFKPPSNPFKPKWFPKRRQG